MLSPNFQIRPLKTDHFLLCLKRLAEMPLYLSPYLGKFFKNSHASFLFCVWNGGSNCFVTSHIDIRGVPTIWLKTVPKRGKMASFLFLVGHHGYWRETPQHVAVLYLRH